MSSKTSISIQKITLDAREERFPPLGKPMDRDRDIGFASIFLTIDNLTHEAGTLIICSIEIQDTNNIVQLSQSSLHEIHLKPLENSVNDFHLTNKTGYAGDRQVRAVISYQVKGIRQKIQSDLVKVQQL